MELTLFDVPASITTDIFTQWLHLSEVCKLDGACCNKSQRACLLELFDCDELIFSNGILSHYRSHNRLLKWIAIRKLRVSQITFPYRLKNIKGYSNSEIMNTTAAHLLSIDFYEFKESMSFMVANMCTNLLSVNFGGVDNYKGSIRAVLMGCKKIKSLSLMGCLVINSQIFESLNLSNLVELDLECSSVDDPTLLAIGEACPALEILKLTYCDQMSDTGIMSIVKKCTGLIHLDLFECKTFTDAAIKAIAVTCPFIKTLDLSNCAQLTDQSFIDIAQNCKNLTVLDMSGLSNLTDAAYLALAEFKPPIQKLNCECSNATDAAMEAIGTECITLTSIDVSRNNFLGDLGISAIAKGCPHLVNFDIRYLPFTNRALYAIAKHCHKLERLGMTGSTQFTEQGVLVLALYCKSLRLVVGTEQCKVINSQLALDFWKQRNPRVEFQFGRPYYF